MAAILLLPHLKELTAKDNGIRRSSPRWVSALHDAISIAKELYDRVKQG
jgi:hypothetical protein